MGGFKLYGNYREALSETISSRLELEKDNRVLTNALVSIRKIIDDVIIDEPMQQLQDVLDVINKAIGDNYGYRDRD